MPISYIHNILILLALGVVSIVVSIVAQQLPVRCVTYWSTLRNVLEYDTHCTGVRNASYWRMLRKALSAVAIPVISVFCLTACQQEETLVPTSGRGGMLELDLLRGGRPVVSTRAVDSDLAVQILDENGNEVFNWSASNVPHPIQFEKAGTYTLKAFTENQDNWQTENAGRGAGCYYAETQVEIVEDSIVRLTLDVPMTNYAVSLKLPELFYEPDSARLFKSYTFTLKSGSRTVTIKEGEKAYFDVNHGFTYALKATNIDGKASQHSAIEYPYSVEAGKLYTVRYSYSSDATKGGADVEVTDDMEDEDKDAEI